MLNLGLDGEIVLNCLLVGINQRLVDAFDKSSRTARIKMKESV